MWVAALEKSHTSSALKPHKHTVRLLSQQYEQTPVFTLGLYVYLLNGHYCTHQMKEGVSHGHEAAVY